MQTEKFTANLIVADILARWPQTVSVFNNLATACVGCSLAPFCTLAEVSKDYNLSLGDLIRDLQACVENSDGQWHSCEIPRKLRVANDTTEAPSPVNGIGYIGLAGGHVGRIDTNGLVYSIPDAYFACTAWSLDDIWLFGHAHRYWESCRAFPDVQISVALSGSIAQWFRWPATHDRESNGFWSPAHHAGKSWFDSLVCNHSYQAASAFYGYHISWWIGLAGGK